MLMVLIVLIVMIVLVLVVLMGLQIFKAMVDAAEDGGAIGQKWVSSCTFAEAWRFKAYSKTSLSQQ